MGGCSGDCGSCSSKSESCGSMKFKANDNSNIKRMIGVVSGKGGVGKSLTCAALASIMAGRGYNVGVIDGDILGASMPHIFGMKGGIMGDNGMMYPAITQRGIKLISINLLLDNPESPVVWRGSMLSNCLKQFYSDVIWEDIDYMFVDMPPGTGDIALTAFQSYPIDGIVIVTSPQDLVSMIVKKAYNMAKMLNVPIIGLVENMSYLTCPGCDSIIYPFGEGRAADVASDLSIKLLAKLPIDSKLAIACDNGKLEELSLLYFEPIADSVEEFFK